MHADAGGCFRFQQLSFTRRRIQKYILLFSVQPLIAWVYAAYLTVAPNRFHLTLPFSNRAQPWLSQNPSFGFCASPLSTCQPNPPARTSLRSCPGGGVVSGPGTRQTCHLADAGRPGKTPAIPSLSQAIGSKRDRGKRPAKIFLLVCRCSANGLVARRSAADSGARKLFALRSAS